MVYGNMSAETSGTGVCFTRNPANGHKELFGEFLYNAQAGALSGQRAADRAVVPAGCLRAFADRVQGKHARAAPSPRSLSTPPALPMLQPSPPLLLQGEDVVAGIRTPMPVSVLEQLMPNVAAELLDITTRLEAHMKDMQVRPR